MFGPAEGGPGVARRVRVARSQSRHRAGATRRDRRPLLRNAVEVERHPRRLRRHGHPHDGRALEGIRPRRAAHRLRQLVVLGGTRPGPREGDRARTRSITRWVSSTPSTSPRSTSCRTSPSPTRSTASSSTRPARAPARDRTSTSSSSAPPSRRASPSPMTGDAAHSPATAGCCIPSSPQSATRREAADVARSEFDAYVSCNRTCEIGMTRATGHPYQHVLEVLDRHSRSSQ